MARPFFTRPSKKGSMTTTKATEASTAIVGSIQQEAVWELMLNSKDHLVVEAYAGTGKTFTMLHGLALARQASKLPGVVGMVAYNKEIADELKLKVPSNVMAKTIHSLGFELLNTINNANSKLRGDGPVGFARVDGRKVSKRLDALIHIDHLESRYSADLRQLIVKTISLLKNLDLGAFDSSNGEFVLNPNQLYEMMETYDLEFTDKEQIDVLRYIRHLMEHSRNNTMEIDYDDMIWLPLHMARDRRLPAIYDSKSQAFDWLIVDEAQDLNRSRMNLIRSLGKRIIAVGDPNQAIYGFAGADSNALETLVQRLSLTGAVQRERLTFTRRCPVSHVKAVNRLLPDFEALPEAGKGELYKMTTQKAIKKMAGGDLVLCRTNAPLVKLAFKLAAEGKPCFLKSTDLEKILLDMINKATVPGDTVVKLIRTLNEKVNQAVRGIGDSKVKKARYRRLVDRVDVIKVLSESCVNSAQVKDKIRYIFNRKDTGECIKLCTIHGAKGLESKNVFIIHPELLPHPLATSPVELEQERNCEIVALTRSLHTLVMVVDKA